MNKKECEKIGYLLAEYGAPEAMCQGFFDMDPRIEPEYEAYRGVYAREEAVSERFGELMKERFGVSWSLQRASKAAQPDLYEQARREIYGEDYHPDLFKSKRKERSDG